MALEEKIWNSGSRIMESILLGGGGYEAKCCRKGLWPGTPGKSKVAAGGASIRATGRYSQLQKAVARACLSGGVSFAILESLPGTFFWMASPALQN